MNQRTSSRSRRFAATMALTALAAALPLAVPALANSETVVRSVGAEYVSEKVTPWVLDVDLRDLPKVGGWQPGDPIEIVPEGLYEDRAVEPNPSWVDPHLQRDTEGMQTFTAEPGVLFQSHPFGAGFPPDVNGDIGPSFYISMVNASRFAIWNKAGGVVAGPSALSSLWTANGGSASSPCADGDGDPIVRYDSLASRWFMTEFDITGNTLCFYVARTSNPVTGGWYVYDFSAPSFPDYPQYGVWTGAWYVSTFESPNIGLYAFDKNAMLAGDPATFQRFSTPHLFGTSPRVTRMLPLDLDGGVAPALPAAGGLFVRTVDETQDNTDPRDRIEMWSLRPDFGNPGAASLTQMPDIATAFELYPCSPGVRDCIEQPGTTVLLDALFNRSMRRAQYRNFGSYEVFLMTQIVDAGQGVTGQRWWEIRRPLLRSAEGADWALFQQGTYAPDDAGRFMGSAAINGEGNIALGYSVSSSEILPEIRITGRFDGDPAGLMTVEELTLKEGVGVQTQTQRWGDYSAMNVDPSDDTTFWYTNQIVGSGGLWESWVGSFTLNGPDLFSDGFESGDTSEWDFASP